MGVLKTEEVASLYRRYAGMVYQIGLMLLKNAPDAEDAVQTVFRRAMERDEPFGGPDHPCTARTGRWRASAPSAPPSPRCCTPGSSGGTAPFSHAPAG